ncbi:MAG: Glu-tRNA(Gln) amidotransferase subunit GatE [Bacteroidetes bacterium]|nr:Glu-tRNA(Gln) amidotransferase subunit GatE [Bacteroidota bacterium]
MKQDPFDPHQNYEETRNTIGYVTRKEATQKDYDRIGFMSGLEVHQQLDTKEKLFCRCPAGIYQKPDEFDAEVIRHMRPTLSELGEYDGTALMEFKTRKEIVYRISNKTACTYDVDDTPPFPVNREALNIALELSLLSNLKIVGEVHITRKQYLDGSIPTGFQRTAIIGVEGEIQLRNKKVRLIQLSLEEDSCREVSDIGHQRIYRTDRLGIPLIETVTYPDFKNPDEVKEGADYIRFLNRSTGRVKTGIGSTRADVNVSCEGGTRVEIKGVAHTGWMPELTHNEAFRQYALLHIREILNTRIKEPKTWETVTRLITTEDLPLEVPTLKEVVRLGYPVYIINLPHFHGILSHFLQPEKTFADELTNRLKVIACIEKPNMLHSEMVDDIVGEKNWDQIRDMLNAGEEDVQVILWGPEADIPTALETVEERCQMALERVPNETRKSFENGTTIFERVLPGADRMYPDTDTAPIPLDESLIEEMASHLPVDISDRIAQLNEWNIPGDTFSYLLKNNLVPLIGKIRDELGIPARFTATLLAHKLNYMERQLGPVPGFTPEKVYDLLAFLKSKKLDPAIAKKMLWIIYRHPERDFDSVLVEVNFKEHSHSEIEKMIPRLVEKYQEIKTSTKDGVGANWVMGELRGMALGNISLSELSKHLASNIQHPISNIQL